MLTNNMEKVGEIEGLKLSGVSVRDLLSDKFVKNMEALKLNLDAITLVLIKEDGEENKKTVMPFIIGHQNSQELKDKVLHISGSKEKELEELAKAIKETLTK